MTRYRKACASIASIFAYFALQTSANAATVTHEKLNDTTEIIAIKGDIVTGDLDQFRQISLRYPKAVVVLNSRGGLIMPAIEIGKIIKIAGYATVVDDNGICASACALIWMAGNRRLLSTNGHIGFHASYTDDNGKSVESGVANALVGNYLTLLGASAKTIVFATTAPPNSILWLTKANRGIAGIDFEELGPTAKEREAPSKSISTQSSKPRTAETIKSPSITEAQPSQILSPSPLPIALFKSGEKWVKYNNTSYIDMNSFRIIIDASYRKKVISYWMIDDIFEDKSILTISRLYIDCDNESERIAGQYLTDSNGNIDYLTYSDYTNDRMPYLSLGPGSLGREIWHKTCH